MGPECPQKTDKFGIKIRGCFGGQDEAKRHAARLQKEDATFDVYVVDMFQWLVIPPKDAEIETNYAEEKLQEMMTAYSENQAQARRLFEDRKKDMMAKPLPGIEEMQYIKPGDENSKYYSKPDEPPIPHPADILEDLKKEFPDKTIEELVTMADKKVADEIKERQEKREVDEAKEAGPSGEGSACAATGI